jgi:hypothetical protein
MHVVAGAKSYEVLLSDGSKRTAHLVAGDKEADVALLELDGATPMLRPLELRDPATLPIGSPVLAIGHPHASQVSDARDEGLMAWSVSRGVLAAKNEHQIKVDAQLNPGNSGGPVLDCEGHVIGVASRVWGTLGFAASPREVLDLERSPKLPGLSFVPQVRVRVGASLRAASFTSFGPSLQSDFVFFDRLHLTGRVTALLAPSTETRGDHVITSRFGVHAHAGLGYGFRIKNVEVVPSAGLAAFDYTEHGVQLSNGALHATSEGRRDTRFAPGLALQRGPLGIDYKMEIDFGAVGDSAHLLSLSLRLF